MKTTIGEHDRHIMQARRALVEAWDRHDPQLVEDAWKAISYHMHAANCLRRGETVPSPAQWESEVRESFP